MITIAAVGKLIGTEHYSKPSHKYIEFTLIGCIGSLYPAVCQLLCKSQIAFWTKHDLHNLCDTVLYTEFNL